MSSKEQSQKNDVLIQDLVIYEITKGATRTLEQKDIITLQQRFSEYKGLIKRGEFTYEELSERIYSKYGITKPLVQTPKFDSAYIDQIISKAQKVMQERKTPPPPPPPKLKWYQKLF